jgi:hypothetical protein
MDNEKLLAQARTGDATAAAELWRAIAEGRVSDALAAAWARDVAALVVAKVLNPDIPANRRAELGRLALGLEGRVDANAELRDLALQMPDVTPRALSEAADLIVDVGGAKPYQVRRKIEYIRRRDKSKK